jgi:hypothetical protein
MAVAGWYRKPQEFDLDKFGRTVITGGIVGAIAGVTGASYAAVETWGVQTSAIFVLELAGKIVWRRVKPLIFK